MKVLCTVAKTAEIVGCVELVEKVAGERRHACSDCEEASERHCLEAVYQ